MSDISYPTDPATDSAWIEDAGFLDAIIETQQDVAVVELDVQMVMQIVAERAQKLTGAEGASVQMLEGDQLVCHGVSGRMTPFYNLRMGMDSSLSGYALRTGQSLCCRDTLTDSRVDLHATQRMGIRSLVVVPVFHGARAPGVLSVSSSQVATFNLRHVAALRLMAGLVGGAIIHASEFDIKKRLLAERTKALVALRESEERFRSAFEHAAIGMAIVGLDGRWKQVNHSVCSIVGYTETELLATDFQSITHPADLETDLSYVRQLIAGEIRDYQMVKRYIHKYGHLVWVLLSVSVVRSEAGQPLYFISQIQDITRRQQAEDALRASENEFRSIFEMTGVGTAQGELKGRFVRVNAKLCEILGYSADELCSMDPTELGHPDDRALTAGVGDRMRNGELDHFTVEKRYIRKDGRVIWAIVNATILRDAERRPYRSITTFQDITDRKRAESLERDRRCVLEMVAKDLPLPDVLSRLAESVQRQQHDVFVAVIALQDGLLQLHAPGLPDDWRDAVQKQSLSLTANLSRGVTDAANACGVTFFRRDELWADLRPLAIKYDLQACWATAIHATDQTPLGLLAVFSRACRAPTDDEVRTFDMASKLATICIEHHNSTRQLAYLVQHDALTGLPNRLLFEDRLQNALQLARRNGRHAGVMVLDIDRFKSVNDTYGHHTGDHLIQQFAHRVRSQLRESDTMARLGGDEFAVVLSDLGSSSDAAVVAQKIVDSLLVPFDLGERSLTATSSIGIATFPEGASDAVSLQKKADEALYRVKQRGRNGFSF